MKPILILVTNQAQYANFDIPTGLWLSELTHFYHTMEVHHIPVQIASLNGGQVPIDPASLQEQFLDDVTKTYYHSTNFMAELTNSKSLKDFDPDDFSAIYFTGGHGAMYDFAENPLVADWIIKMDKNQGIVSAVCHGVAALTNSSLNNQTSFVKGKIVTGYTNIEEDYVQHTNHVPFLLEDRLGTLEADFQQAAPFKSYVCRDGNLITGQNPQSTSELAEEVARVLTEQNK